MCWWCANQWQLSWDSNILSERNNTRSSLKNTSYYCYKAQLQFVGWLKQHLRRTGFRGQRCLPGGEGESLLDPGILTSCWKGHDAKIYLFYNVKCWHISILIGHFSLCYLTWGPECILILGQGVEVDGAYLGFHRFGAWLANLLLPKRCL